jgi:hypothetical protein
MYVVLDCLYTYKYMMFKLHMRSGNGQEIFAEQPLDHSLWVESRHNSQYFTPLKLIFHHEHN